MTGFLLLSRHDANDESDDGCDYYILIPLMEEMLPSPSAVVVENIIVQAIHQPCIHLHSPCEGRTMVVGIGGGQTNGLNFVQFVCPSQTPNRAGARCGCK